MQISQLTIKNFRGIKYANIYLPEHAVLIGDNNTGKTTVLEAIDLALGPDRLNRNPPINEHDFYQGKYISDSLLEDSSSNSLEQTDEPPDEARGVDVIQDDNGIEIAEVLSVENLMHQAVEQQEEEPVSAQENGSTSPEIEIEVCVTNLNDEQKAKFGDAIEFWDSQTNTLYSEPNPAGVDQNHISEAIRITFKGFYDPEEDDFEGATYFTRSLTESVNPTYFTKRNKQICGFLYLRSIRTGSRALSLERGSLLDIILRLKEVRPRMWEDTINKLASFKVADDPELGISDVLESINEALKKYVPKEWGVEPHLKISNLTRDDLRKVITAFIATGEGEHAAPFYRQGTGTINMLVLAMLSQIAADKSNVIFAMEEPETAIAPYAQKRIVHEIRKLASQTLFTSHSPYVLEEFSLNETIVLQRNESGQLAQHEINLPENIKLKRYRQEFRTRFCEGLLSRRVLLAEGATETASFPVVCRRLTELDPDNYSSLESLGICTVDAGGDNEIPGLAELYGFLGKQVFALCDKQTADDEANIYQKVEQLFMHEEHGFEELVLKNTTDTALIRFAGIIEWPPHILAIYPNPLDDLHPAFREYFNWSKGNWGVADFLAQCEEAEIPEWLRNACKTLKEICDSAPVNKLEAGGVVTSFGDDLTEV